MARGNDEVSLLVGFSKVSASNIVAEIIAPALSHELGQSVRILSLPGENGARATEQTAQAAPDGLTLCITVPTHVLNSLFGDRERHDVTRDFAPVAVFGRNPLVLAVSKTLGVNTLEELIVLARSQPGQLAYGTSAIGGGPHLAALLFCDSAGVRLQLRVYAETHRLYEDLQRGDIALTFNNTMSALPLAREGKLVLLGVTSGGRSPAAPDIPAFSEAGLANYQFENWVGLLAPARTPAPVVARINQAVCRAVADPDVRQQLLALGVEPLCSQSQEFAACLRAEMERWVPFVRAHVEEFSSVNRERLGLP